MVWCPLLPSDPNQFLKHNPVEDLDSYLDFDEWSLISKANEWAKRDKDSIGQGWKRIIERAPPRWRRIFEMRYQLERAHPITRQWREDEIQREIYNKLPTRVKKEVGAGDIRVDIASLHPRPQNPYLGQYPVRIYDPMTKETATEHWERILMGIPAKAFIVRIFALSEDYTNEIYDILNEILAGSEDSGDNRTNI